MLAIRLQRTGRKGHAMFRMIVQDSRWSPKSGKVVARLGSFDPHAKVLSVDKDKAAFYLKNGAQPSVRTALLLKKDGVKLPAWVEMPYKKSNSIKNPDKLRRNQSNEPVAAEAADNSSEGTPTDASEPTTATGENDAPEDTNATEQAASGDNGAPADSTTDKKPKDETTQEESASE